jgi:AcrR family transcriptional regulator
MAKKASSTQRREESLSRDRIIEASIALLDSGGESGLTFRALSERLATGPGAIYWHIDNKSDLLSAACDAIIARTINAPLVSATPKAAIRALALSMFDEIDAHPWVGSALTRAPGQLPMVRILERIGQQVCALCVPNEEQWATASACGKYLARLLPGLSGTPRSEELESPEKRCRLAPTFPRQSRLPGLGNNASRSSTPFAVSGLRQR